MFDFIYEIGDNFVLWTAVTAWFVAQLTKFILEIYLNKNMSLYVLLFSTGGMPSSHSAFVVALATAIGLKDGFSSTIFALSAAFSMLTMADAAGVRRAAGKQAKVLNMLIEHLNDPNIGFETKLRELLGHTPFEVGAGATLGIVIGVISGYINGII